MAEKSMHPQENDGALGEGAPDPLRAVNLLSIGVSRLFEHVESREALTIALLAAIKNMVPYDAEEDIHGTRDVMTLIDHCEELLHDVSGLRRYRQDIGDDIQAIRQLLPAVGQGHTA